MAKDKISELVNNIKELYIKNDYKFFKDEILNISTDYSPLPLEYRQGFMIFDTKNCNNDYKHRYYAYYDLRMSKEEDEKLLTFILFNPSFANVSDCDPTISNCIRLAQKSNLFNAIEVLNIYSYRCATVSKKCIEGNETNKDFIKEYLSPQKNLSSQKNLVEAWGFGKENKKIFKNDIEEIKEIISKYSHKKYKLNVKKDVLNTLNDKIFHPAGSSWSVFGGFDIAAELTEMDT